MGIPSIPTRHQDEAAHRQRMAESINSIRDFTFDDSRVRTQAEITAGVTPINYAYPPGVDLRYGVVRDNSTDNQTALTNLIAVGAQGVQIILTPGIAVHSDTLVWGFAGLRVSVEGNSQLRHTGTGKANTIDAGVSSGLFNIIIDGYLEELGSANTTHCWYLRGLGRCRIDMRAKNATQYGCLIEFAVTCDFRFMMTSDDGTVITTQPTYGLALNKRGTGEQVAYCRFINVVTENLTSNTGILLASVMGCVFEGGSSEDCNVGIECNGSENLANTFLNFDLEQNITRDVSVSGGTCLTFINCQSVSSTAAANISLSGGDSTTFSGGFYRWVDCVGGSATNTNFFGVQVPDNGSVGITGSGSKKIVGCVKVDGSRIPVVPPTSGYQYDQVGNTLAFPTAPTIFGGTTHGTQAYTTQSGNFTRVDRLCYFSITLVLSSNAGGAGNATISLPFTSANFVQTIVIGDYTGVTLGAAGRTLAMRISSGVATGLLLETDTGSVSNFIAIGSISGTASIVISGSYQIA